MRMEEEKAVTGVSEAMLYREMEKEKSKTTWMEEDSTAIKKQNARWQEIKRSKTRQRSLEKCIERKT